MTSRPLILALLLSLAACQGKSAAEYHGSSRTILAPDGTVTITRTGRSYSEALAPPGARDASPATADVDHATAASGSSWEPKLPDIIKSHTSLIYPIAAVLLLLLSVLAFWQGKIMPGVLLVGAAGLSAAAIWLGPWLAVLVIVALVIAGVWLVAQWMLGHSTRVAAIEGAAKLAKEGKVAEAFAALRAGDPVADAAFNGASKPTYTPPMQPMQPTASPGVVTATTGGAK